jgi:hypothetical protein
VLTTCGSLLLDLRGLTDAAAQVIELRTTHVPPNHDLDPGKHRGVYRECPLYPDPEAELANREGLAGPRALATDDGSLEDLVTLAISLDHAHVHLQSVTRGEIGDVLPQTLPVDDVCGVHGARPFRVDPPRPTARAGTAT